MNQPSSAGTRPLSVSSILASCMRWHAIGVPRYDLGEHAAVTEVFIMDRPTA